VYPEFARYVCKLRQQCIELHHVNNTITLNIRNGRTAFRQKDIVDQIAAVETRHGGDIPAAFERAIRVAVERREFLRPFTQIPEVALDTAAIARAWKSARDGVLRELRAKQAAPLESTALSEKTDAAIAA
jgi:hypothetical protein